MDPWHFGVDPDPDPRIHAFNEWIRIRIRILLFSSLTFKTSRKNNYKKISAYYVLKVHFSKIKSPKEVTKQKKSRFSYYFCLMIEGFGSGTGSILLTNRTGFGRPKNMRIRWNRIRNTYGFYCFLRIGSVERLKLFFFICLFQLTVRTFIQDFTCNIQQTHTATSYISFLSTCNRL